MHQSEMLDRDSVLSRAISLFEAGELEGAESLCRRLQANDDELAIYLLAQIFYRRGAYQAAIEQMLRLTALQPMVAQYHNDYGVMLAATGRWAEAEAAHRMAAVLDTNNVDARFNIALALFKQKRLVEARLALDRVAPLMSDISTFYSLLGELLAAEDRKAEAVIAFSRAIELGLETAEVYLNLGLALEDMGRGEESQSALEKAGEIETLDAPTCFRLANLYRARGDLNRAERYYRRAVSLAPDLAEAHNNLGLLLDASNQPEHAALCFERALCADPTLDAALTNLGSNRVKQGWLEDAVDSFRKALAINPASAEAWNNLGAVYCRLHRLGEASEAYRKSIAIKPDYVQARLNLGILLLLEGRFAEGWANYEYRWAMPGVAENRPKFSRPEWDGAPLNGESLLVYSEQGMGDNLQFVRYLPLLRQRYPDSKIYLWCLTPLFRLFQENAAAWGIEALPLTVPGGLPPIDQHIALLSLPRLLGTELESIPDNVPYLRAAPERVAAWSQRLAALPGKKVGLVWASGEIYAFHKFRTVRLRQLAPLFDIPGISWVSLQKGDGARQIAEEGLDERILDLMDDVEDFADTAALVANLDLVISVDTSVPHLAGAMGVPVWLLDRFDTDWRWLLDRTDSPWYPSMKIFRQASFGEWEPVMVQAAEALQSVVAGRSVVMPKPAAKSFESKSERCEPLPRFGSELLQYQLVQARHGWMLANPNDFYIGQALIHYGEYNEIEAEFLGKCLIKKGCIVEVGANMGSHTIGLAKIAAQHGEQMYVFEPQPVVFQNLCANLALNGMTHVRALPFACGDEPKTVFFSMPNYGRSGNFGGVSMKEAAIKNDVAVSCVRLDDSLGDDPVALIKVDVEGFELMALRGGERIIDRWQPVLYVENDRVELSQALIEWLWCKGYSLYWHIPYLFNPANFFGKKENMYKDIASFNMLCLPGDMEPPVAGLAKIIDASKHPLA